MLRKSYFHNSCKYISVFCILFLTSFSSVQTLSPDRETKIRQLKDRTDLLVTEIQPGILKIQFPDGISTVKNTNDLKLSANNRIMYSPTYDSTIIDLRTIDTIPFYQKYSFWQEVDAGSPYNAPPLIGDVNNNGLPEIYGIIQDYGADNSDISIMEENAEGIFDSVFTYDSMTTPRAIYDVNKDGLKEVPFRRYPSDSLFPGSMWCFFTQPTDILFATDLHFIFYPFTGYNNQLNFNTFGDWDGDASTDQVFIRDCCPNSFYVYEYNNLANNFDSVYFHDLSQYGLYFAGFAIGDFNQNGKTEFWEGGVNGEVISIENCGDNCYEPIYQGSVETNNAYLYASTDDLDGNGKPEAWIGGDFFLGGESYTRITIFEADGQSNYVAVGKIDFIGAFSFYAFNMQVLDVDKDGKDEVMVCLEEHLIILKFTGSPNHQTYSVFYLKYNDLAQSGRNSVFYGATMYDVTGDGKEDIIIHMDEIISNIRLFTYIYKADFSVNIEEQRDLPGSFELLQNYPNPFNPSTRIRYNIPLQSTVSIKVFDILGKEINTLLEKELSPGSYTIDWAAKDSNGQLLPSGVYLIRLNAINTNNSYIKTIKTVLVK